MRRLDIAQAAEDECHERRHREVQPGQRGCCNHSRSGQQQSATQVLIFPSEKRRTSSETSTYGTFYEKSIISDVSAVENNGVQKKKRGHSQTHDTARRVSRCDSTFNVSITFEPHLAHNTRPARQKGRTEGTAEANAGASWVPPSRKEDL